MAFALSGILFGCGSVDRFESFERSIMGTQFHLKAACPSKIDRHAVNQILEGIDASMSTYRARSEVSKLNVLGGAKDWYPVSKDLLHVLKTSLWIAEESGGAFDPTVGSLVEAMGFGVKQPSSNDLDNIRSTARVGYRAIRIRLDPPGIRMIESRLLDFSAIAKGYAIDKVASLLSKRKCSDFLVFLGGEVKVRGRRSDGQLWQVAIESPLDGKPVGVVRLRNRAVASSGSYRNYRWINGSRISHLIDPRNNSIVEDVPDLVTVILPSAELADAYATALFIVGISRGLQLANRYQIPAIFGSVQNGSLTWQVSNALQETNDLELR